MLVAAVLAPRFRLLTALDERRELLKRPAALAPEPGAAQLIGETSGPAEALGVRAGMRLGEALSRCPELILVTPDSERAERAWEQALRRLESNLGAEVESERPGEAFFGADGLGGLWGGIEGVLLGARREAGMPVRLAAAPGRFCAYAAATCARPRAGPGSQAGPVIVSGSGARHFLAPLPIALLSGRLLSPRPAHGGAWDAARDRAATGADDLPNQLERLGVDTLGRLADLPRDAVADRFGDLGLRALSLA
ncbi:MAG: hypothetical protein M3M99_05505, partial [Actinomycetota bacterium]|nr:hypothetical protein [Actinomycetota bacterium]